MKISKPFFLFDFNADILVRNLYLRQSSPAKNRELELKAVWKCVYI